MSDITEYRGIRGLVACELLSDTEEGLVYDDEMFIFVEAIDKLSLPKRNLSDSD